MENNQEKEIILLKDLGMRFATQTSKRKYRYGLYKCFCGNEFETHSYDINRGKTQSCGCLKVTHKLSNHRLYKTWHSMIDRCCNINNKRYKDYGSRGIVICNEWLSVENFINDMYPSYQEGLTIDRIDNNKGYSKDNCRWINETIQNRNRRVIQKNNTSGFRGVYWCKDINKWKAAIGVNSKYKHLGCFADKIEAAKVYDKYVLDNNLEHTINGV